MTPLDTQDDPADTVVEASSSQRSLWLGQQLAPSQDGYAMPMVWRVREDRIAADELRDAVAALIARHEILRTAFVERNGTLWQRIGPPWVPLVERADFHAVPAGEQTAAWQAWVRRLTRRPFDLASGRLVRCGLVELGPAGQLLVLCPLHLVCDGYSVSVLLSDMDAFLRDGALAAGGPQYREFVRRQEAWLATPEAGEALDFWVSRLRGAPSRLPLPAPAIAEPNGAVPIPMPAGIRERLPGLRRRYRVSWFMVVAATLAASVHRWSGLPDVTFGCQVANRTDDAYAAVVGPCTNAVALRSRCDATTTLADLVTAARDQVLGALEHQQVPFEAVVSALRPPRRVGHTPYRDVGLGMTTLAARPRVGDRVLEYLPTSQLDGETKFGVAVTVSATGSEPWGVLAHRGDRCAAAQARRMAAEFAAVLDWITTAPPDAPFSAAPRS
jgi:hypothetical protein